MECDEKIGARIRQFMDDCNTFYEQGQLSKARDSLLKHGVSCLMRNIYMMKVTGLWHLFWICLLNFMIWMWQING